ncbi:CAF17-like 4Fe-4S cluster assembly/insertion protein YgfZ [Nigerium massiliense]|uniref:CAF17-like 4Fe-4S cluster assembly/insertion protein YgfZ n=1 Tax=Nigerium massiliense TaxID=1522317 RepID=UPI00058CE0CC|nr:folate-binding protein YgfZ [Nigerium massiliense]
MITVLNDAGPDAGVPLHYGDPLREQRRLEAGTARVDLSHRPVFAVAGADRLTWLHALTSQQFVPGTPGRPISAYILDPNGHIEHAFAGVDDGEAFLAHTEPEHLEQLLAWLGSMVFASRVELSDRSADFAVVGDAGGERIVPRDRLDEALGDVRAGTWAHEALRIAAGRARPFLDTDEKTVPNEVAAPHGDRLGEAVHLAKGCYRGQETVARIHTLGRPPRRLTLLHLDGTANALPEVGEPVLLGDRPVGRVGTSAQHHELGPIALALVKRNIAVDAELRLGPIAAAQEVLVDPEVGLHVRPRLG